MPGESDQKRSLETDLTQENEHLRASLPCFLTLFFTKRIDDMKGDPPATGAEGADGAADGATTGPAKLSASQAPLPLKANAQSRNIRKHHPWESQASAVEGKHIRRWLGRCLLAEQHFRHGLSTFES